ncbi:T9SS type A sorting domain-containing protein [Danxiaibacter flavus]|uniref:T9SS type A sorting domain-containing protein n=1 Tax=Danxiaibacter flavus TaxID=3049108 RepID=A0ABV3Z9E9_9BACT|nr:T9SS type A sorting domain-containing protein [Chitinophagaceae bacterium DXS]
MTKPFIGVILLLHAMVCCYAKTISLTTPTTVGKVYITNPDVYNYTPGDTFFIGHSISGLNLYNVKGSPDKYVVVTAAEGVTINGGVVIASAKFVKFQNLNINAGRLTMGFKAQYCSDITLDNIQVTDATIGISIKNDPKDNDPSTYYPVTINNLVINNCSVKNCNNEGFYLGHTFSAPLYNQIPSPIMGLTVSNVSVENTGWDGLQITNAQNCKVNGVTTVNTGTANQTGQKSCVALQDAVTGSFENINCKDATGGLTILGKGEFVIKNVTLDHVATSAGACAFFVDNRSDRGLNLPPRKLMAENISILNGNKSARLPVYVLNSSGFGALAQQGIVKNLKYNAEEWAAPGKVVDYVPNVYITDTTKQVEQAPPVDSSSSTLQPSPVSPVDSVIAQAPPEPLPPVDSTSSTVSVLPTAPIGSASPGQSSNPTLPTEPVLTLNPSKPLEPTKPVSTSPGTSVPAAKKDTGFIKLYSNPNNGRFRVAFTLPQKSKIKMLIVSMSGNVVYQNQWNKIDYLDQMISLPSTGMYILKVMSDSGFEDMKKVIVVK